MMLPHREPFLVNVASGKSAAEGLALLRQWLVYVEPLRVAMWAYFKHRGIDVIA